MAIFSIITANYNSGEKLLATSESILGQGVDLEYIIIDGASNDRSREIGFDLAQRHPDKVRIVSEPDKGIYDAMNKGIAMAKGRYIYFIGAGDILFTDSLQQIRSYLPANDRAFVYGDVIRAGKPYDGPFTWRKLIFLNICHQCIFYGRETFDICGTYNLRYPRFADWEMNYRMFGRREIEKKYVPVQVAIFEEGGVSASGDKAFDSDRYKLVKRHLGMSRYLKHRAGRYKQRLTSIVKNRSFVRID
jgi:glycosyltransferase involved in cell wall biosynthesis